MADEEDRDSGGMTVRPETVAELRSYFDRRDPLESALDLSRLELDAEQRDELQSFAQSLRPERLGFLKSVVANVANRGTFSSFVACSAILWHANSLESLAIEGGDDEDHPRLSLVALGRRADALLDGVTSNESCQLKAFKTSIAAASESLVRFLSSPRCLHLERLDVSCASPMERNTLDGLCCRMRYSKRLTKVSVDCADHEDAVTLMHAAISTVEELDMCVKSYWDEAVQLSVVVPLLRYSRVTVLRLYTEDYGGPAVNALKYLSDIEISSSIEDLELDGFELLDEADPDDEVSPPAYNHSIKSLRCRNCRFGRHSLTFLLSLEGVASLELVDCCTEGEIHPKNLMFQLVLPNLPRLQQLSIANFYETQDALKDLATAVSRSRKLESTKLVFEMDDENGSLDRHHVADLVRNCRGSLTVRLTDSAARQGIFGLEAGLRSNDKGLTHFSLLYRTPLSATATGDLRSVLDAACSVQRLQSLHVSVDATSTDGNPPAAILNDDCAALVCRLLGAKALHTLGLGRCQIPNTSFQGIVDVLRSRIAPLHLHFDSVEFEAGTLARFSSEIQHLSCLKELQVPTKFSSDADLHAFLKDLPCMKDLNVLRFEPAFEVALENDDVGALLVDGVRSNAGLVEIQGLKYAPGSYETMRCLDFALRRNRYGWRLLSREHVPAALWPYVLANIDRDNANTAPFLFMFLRGMMGRIRKAAESGQP